ncbi:MAG: PorP/SprF family type IX secretion system membrane protein [Bacteroidales bacterium]|nr:PorP/SprF family type IX secretion system membrane protein [Bacteroidales bacterium]
MYKGTYILSMGAVLMFCSGMTAGAQDAAFSQFYANALYMNPALAGIEGPVKLYIGYRNQWPGVTDSYVTYHASYEQHIEWLHGGVGLHMMNDRQAGGLYNTLSLDAMYAYHLKVSHALTLSGALQATLGQRVLKSSSLVMPDMIQPGTGNIIGGSEISGDYRRLYPDFSLGFAGFFRNYFGGIAVHHLHGPRVSVTGGETDSTRLGRKFTLHAGALIPIYERRLGREVLQLSPHLVFIQQQSYQQLNYGFEVLYRNLIGGIWGRHDLFLSYGTLIFSAGYGTDQFRFRYSYDSKLILPDINIPNMGAHELSLVIIFESLDKSKKHRAIKCPEI